VRVDEENIQVEEGPGPEYETLGSLGTMLQHGNLAGVAKANELCNRLGVDTISVGSTIAWAMEAIERGDLTTADINGLELAWGNTDAILAAIKAIAYGEGGLGTLLTQGSRRAAQELGKESSAYAINVKGLDLAMHHPRVFNGLALSYAFLPQGASHMEGGFNQRGPDQSVEDWVESSIRSMRQSELANDAVMCSFIASEAPLEFVADLFESATGEPYTPNSLEACFDRGYLLRYAFNLKMGHTPKENELPERIVKQMEQAQSRWEVDWPLAKSAYKAARGFDGVGYPTEETLQNAGLEDVIKDMGLWK
jgi:aldehyde:ferredoxin oxidoreductase